MSKRDLFDLRGELEELKDHTLEEISMEELINDKFLEDYSDFYSTEEFLTDYRYDIESFENLLENCTEEQLDVYVAENTEFCTWQEMIEKAKQFYLEN